MESWENEESDNPPRKWPTASTRLNWARNNYQNHSLQWKLQRFLILLMNMIALNDQLEEEGGEALVSPKQRKQWIEMYETFRPTQQAGRPRNNE
ncbi:hypothetical protein LCGC14_0295330 [marine sediment metagenome]|uniref:Uncharacterized protein n=1 Tax=marine sediment metagenome TaxID=412755 RepID=A0A0F9TS76_9ZZZZ